MEDLDLSSIVIGAAIAVPITAVVTIFASAAWLVLSGVVASLFSETSKVSGNWTATFEEPSPDGEPVDAREEVRLWQFGRLVWGAGRGIDDYDRTFKYRGEVKKGTLTGSYRRTGSDTATGKGAFQLKILGNESEMKGKCVWYDYDTDEIESSDYVWTKKA